MKNSIIILGLVVLSFTNANAATEFDTQILDQQESATYNVETSKSNEVKNETDTAFFDPNSVIKINYVKTIEQEITENKLITETREEIAEPLLIVATLDKITEDNQIIENNISNEVFPLDFEKINRAVKNIRVYNKAAITVDLKL